MYNFYGDCIASENLRNNSICVKEGKLIRNTKRIEDIDKEMLVFVSNVPNVIDDMIIVKKYQPVRYIKLPL